jgi:hypothetical protein
MATVTLTGKFLLPDGSVPTGSLEFTLAAKTEDASGNVNITVPALATIGALGAVSVVLEESQAYDVVAVLTGARPARYSLGRWTCPASGVFSSPVLFDGWKATLTHPDDHLLFSLALLTSTVKTPKRGATDLITDVGSVAYEANGRRFDDDQNASLDISAGNFLVAAGTLIAKVWQDAWAGNDGTAHTIIAGLDSASGFTLYLAKSAANKLLCLIGDTGGLLKGFELAADGTSMPANTIGRVALRWNAGTLKARWNTTDLTTPFTTGGTGVPKDFGGITFLGIGTGSTAPWIGNIAAIRVYDYDLTDGELTAAMAAL